MTKWLVYDIGTTGTKAALIDGSIIRHAVTQGYETTFADGGIVEQHVGDWWQALVRVTQIIEDKTEIEGLIFTGQMQNLILIDRDLQAVRPVILYSDTRAHEESSEVQRIVGAKSLRDVTGNDQGAGSLLAKLRWVHKYEPQSISNSAYLLFGAADYAVLRLTGRAFSDFTTLSTTGLLNPFTRRYIGSDLLELIGCKSIIPLLPNMIPGGAQAGTLLPEPAALLGLPAGLPVYLAAGDAGSATIGANSGEPGSAYAYIGTSGWVAFTDRVAANPDHGVMTLAHPRSQYYIAVAPLMTAGGNLDWIHDLLERTLEDPLLEQALEQPPTGLIYLPYLNGERSPFNDPFARGTFIGLSTQTRQVDLVRAVLEGVALAYRHTLDALAPANLTHLTLTGGGTRSLGWCQLFADILQITVQIAADAENTGLRGAIRACEVETGRALNYALPDLPITHALAPRDQYRAFYSNKYALFRQSYYALKPLFRALHNLDQQASGAS